MSIIALLGVLNLVYAGWLGWLCRAAVCDLTREQRRVLAAAQKLEALIARAVDGQILVTADDGRTGRLVIEACGEDAIRLRVDDRVIQVH